MSLKLILEPNAAKNGFHSPTEYTKARLLEWLKKYRAFEVSPVVPESQQARGYLHGAVEPAWAKWQYGIDPREPGLGETRHYLFLRDFNSVIKENRNGDPERIPQSSQGKLRELLDAYTRYAEENGAPVPNPALFKLYRDKWRIDPRFPTFHDWLAFLHIEEDAMPSAETLASLNESKPRPEYPEYGGAPTI
jgi:hypothetical protein